MKTILKFLPSSRLITALILSLTSGCNFYSPKSDANLSDEADLKAVDLDRVSWEQVNQYIFTPHCISCHSRFQTYARVRWELLSIRKEVIEDREMPPSQSEPLSPLKNELLKRWIDAGAPENPAPLPSPTPSPDPTLSPAPSPELAPRPSAPLQPTYASIHERILVPRCLGCHAPGERAAKVPLNSLRDLLDSPLDLVIPGTPDESTLLLSLTRNDSKRMPPPRSSGPLPPEEIEAIRTWIDRGAKD